MKKYEKVFEWMDGLKQYETSDNGLHKPNKVRGLKGALRNAFEYLNATETDFFNNTIKPLPIFAMLDSKDTFSKEEVSLLIKMIELMADKLPRSEKVGALRGAQDLSIVLDRLLARKHVCLVDFEYNQYRVGDSKSFVSSIVDFGLVVLDSTTLKEVDRISQLLLPFPEMKMATYCKKITGITDEHLEGKPNFEQFVGELDALMAKYPDMAWLHWGGIEGSSLNKEFIRCGREMPSSIAFYDLQPLVSRKFGERQMSLKNASLHQGVTLELDTHRAINDAVYLSALLKSLAESERG